MNLGLKEKRALVLGAAGGLGSVNAESLAAKGAKVSLGDLNAEATARPAAAIFAAGGRAIALKIDLAETRPLTALGKDRDRTRSR